MNQELLKLLHLAGAFALMASIGATFLAGSNKGKALHGISLVLILLVGFAMLKKPPMDQYWWMAKIGLWLVIGLSPLLTKKKILEPLPTFLLTIAAAITAAWLGLAKPF